MNSTLQCLLQFDAVTDDILLLIKMILHRPKKHHSDKERKWRKLTVARGMDVCDATSRLLFSLCDVAEGEGDHLKTASVQEALDAVELLRAYLQDESMDGTDEWLNYVIDAAESSLDQTERVFKSIIECDDETES